MSTLGLAILGIAGPWEWVVILVIVLILFGPGKLPSIGKALGEGLRSFKKATSSDDEIDVTPRSPSQIEGHKPTVDSTTHAESHSKV